MEIKEITYKTKFGSKVTGRFIKTSKGLIQVIMKDDTLLTGIDIIDEKDCFIDYHGKIRT